MLTTQHARPGEARTPCRAGGLGKAPKHEQGRRHCAPSDVYAGHGVRIRHGPAAPVRMREKIHREYLGTTLARGRHAGRFLSRFGVHPSAQAREAVSCVFPAQLLRQNRAEAFSAGVISPEGDTKPPGSSGRSRRTSPDVCDVLELEGSAKTLSFLQMQSRAWISSWSPPATRRALDPAISSSAASVTRRYRASNRRISSRSAARCAADGGRRGGGAVTFVPEFPSSPPETAWMRVTDSGIAGRASQTAVGSRIADLATDLDRRYLRELLPDHANLLANLVRWAARDSIPLSVRGSWAGGLPIGPAAGPDDLAPPQP